MMGRAGVGEEGIIPRLCKDLFDKIGIDDDPDVQYSVEVIKICLHISTYISREDSHCHLDSLLFVLH